MAGSDVFIGWVKDGQVHFGDRWAAQQGVMPSLDLRQDYFMVSGGETAPASTEAALSRRAVIGIAVSAAVVSLSIIGFFLLLQRRSRSVTKVQPAHGNREAVKTENLDPPSVHRGSLEGGETDGETGGETGETTATMFTTSS